MTLYFCTFFVRSLFSHPLFGDQAPDPNRRAHPCSQLENHLTMAPQRKKTTNPGASDAEGSNLHEVPIGQSPQIKLTSAQLAEKVNRIQAECAIEAKKAAAAGKKAAAASVAAKEAAAATTTAEAETLNSLSQLEDDQLEQNLHDELNLELRALEMKKAHLANQLATRKRAAEQT